MLRRGLRGAALVLAGIAALLLLAAAHARGFGFLILAFAVQGLASGWLMRALWAAVLPPLTAVVWAPIGDALSSANSDIPFGVVLLIAVACALAGVVTALLAAFFARERSHGAGVLPGATLLLLLGAVGPLVGCGGEAPAGSPTAPGRPTIAGAATTTAASPGPARPRAAPPSGTTTAPGSSPVPGRRLPGGPRPSARTLPDGTVVVPRPIVAQTERPAERRCAQMTVDRDGVRATVQAPPAPGLRAERVGDAIRVTLDTGSPPRTCRPDYVSVAAESSGDLRAPISRELRLRRLGVQTVLLPLDGADATSVRATMGTDAGRVSPTATVALAR